MAIFWPASSELETVLCQYFSIATPPVEVNLMNAKSVLASPATVFMRAPVA